MWTLNSARTLEKSLSSIAEAIPENSICHKIMVDGGSKDNTVELGMRFGWEVLRSDSGIWRQAKYALNRENQEFIPSFKHDVCISKNCLNRVVSAVPRQKVSAGFGISI